MIDKLKELGIQWTTRALPVPATEKDEVDFTIVIAHRGPAMGLWMTIHSCEIELADKNFKYNYVIVPNGEEKWSHDNVRVFEFLALTGKLRDNIKVPRPLSPPSARNMGAEQANGKYIFFFDNHCMVAKNYFNRAIESMETYGIEMLHSLTRFYDGEFDHWQYELSLEKNFWGGSTVSDRDKPLSLEPFRCAVAGHGGYAVTRKLWKELGGYWEGFQGYGGEECYWDLLCWQMGKEVWIDPQMIHYHWAGERGYGRHFTDEYYVNLLCCALLIGGKEWMMKVFHNFNKSLRKKSELTMFDLMIQATERAAHYAGELAAKRKYSLDNCLEMFKQRNIPH